MVEPQMTQVVQDMTKFWEDMKMQIDKSATTSEDGPCYYCDAPTNHLSGSPHVWPVWLCHSDDPGISKPHHEGCVMKYLPLRSEANV